MRKGRRDGPGGDIRHFTNRESELKTFRRLADGPAGTPLPVVMFYGVGGTGKSWLARRLQQEARDRLGLPTARLDFDPNAGGAGMHSDSASALAEIRRQLDVPCPRFDLAYAMMLHKQGVKEAPTHRHAGQAATAWELTGELANAAVSSIPGGNVLIWLGKKAGEAGASGFGNTALGQWLSSTTGNDDLLVLRRMTHQEIYPELAVRMAEDLEEHLPRRDGKTCRAVVFLDTFEALKVGGQSGTGHHYAREEWVCRFYERIESVLLILSGRDRLTWDETDGDWRSEEYLEQHLVGGLSETDARRFLAECGITQPPLQQAVLAASLDTETPGAQTTKPETAYHPFSLGLCADTIASDRAQGREPEPQSFRLPPGDIDSLAARFLRSLPPHHETWVLHLALTPRFDEVAAKAAYARTVGGEVHHAWDTLLDFSFLRAGEQAGWHTLHPRMCDALRTRLARNSAAEYPAHEAWRAHWQTRSEQETDDAAGLAWYHHWRLDPAVQTAWNQLAQGSRECLDMAGHYRLLDWWTPTALEHQGPGTPQEAAALNDLGAELWRASLGNRAENLQRAIGCYEAALRVYTERDFPQAWATTQNNLGNAYQSLPSGDRAENLQRAIGCYEAALRVYTERAFPQDWATTQNNLGLAYQSLPSGDRAENLQRAIECYEAALRVRTERDFPQDWAMTQNNLGTAYSDLPSGDRAENLQCAIACYEAALRVRTERDFPQAWAETRFNVGVLHLALDDRAGALAAFTDAVRGFRRVGHTHYLQMAEEELAALGAEAPDPDPES